MKRTRSACALWLILLFAACIPASPPANISATPGTAAVITRDSYQNEMFSVTYPTGWRVITSPAGAPPSVTFVAPGDCALIVIATGSDEKSPVSPSCDQPTIQSRRLQVTLGSEQITIAGSAPSAGWDDFVAVMDRVAGTLKAAP